MDANHFQQLGERITAPIGMAHGFVAVTTNSRGGIGSEPVWADRASHDLRIVVNRIIAGLTRQDKQWPSRFMSACVAMGGLPGIVAKCGKSSSESSSTSGHIGKLLASFASGDRAVTLPIVSDDGMEMVLIERPLRARLSSDRDLCDPRQMGREIRPETAEALSARLAELQEAQTTDLTASIQAAVTSALSKADIRSLRDTICDSRGQTLRGNQLAIQEFVVARAVEIEPLIADVVNRVAAEVGLGALRGYPPNPKHPAKSKSREEGPGDAALQLVKELIQSDDGWTLQRVEELINSRFAGSRMPTLEENQSLAKGLNEFAKRLDFRFCCASCGKPALLRCALQAGATRGAFRFVHTTDPQKTGHGAKVALPRLALVASVT